MSIRISLMAVLMLFLLVGCGRSGGDIPTLFPTIAVDETPTEEISGEANDVPTLLPTLTPRVRATLPPTYTPTPGPATPTPDPNTDVPTLSILNVEGSSEACGSFGIDAANSDGRFSIGESPTVAWVEVAGTRWYRLIVFDEIGTERHEELVESTSYSIPVEVFTDELRYGWEVQPLDEFGLPICSSRGGMLDARPE